MVSSRKKSQCAIGSMLDLLNEPATSRSHNQENNSNCSNSLNSSSSTDSESLHTSESFEDDSDDEQNANNNDPLEEDTIGRGPTRQGFRWGTGEKMILELNDDNQVENTNLTDVYKKTCLRRVGKLWKDFKMRTKEKYFRPHRRDKTYLLANRPGRIEEDQWPALVNYWLSKRARKISNRNKRNRKDLQMPHRQGRTDTYNLQNQATLKALKQQLPPELQDDIEANNKIFEDVIRKDAPGCLRSCKIVSKSKKVFTSQQEFDRAVDERVASIQHNLEIKLHNEMDERLSKMKDDWLAEMKTMMQDQSSSFGSPNTQVQESSNSQHQIALNEPLHGLGNSSNNGQTNQSTKVSKEINQSKDDNPPLICSDATSTKEIQKVT
ncbi:OLC1v1035698C1 [Oldenlandia corymbosa var. corymbosa]|uniref:OLC1v1035698C1 n=1 Tax=Oldenlandia corymbosa var. corymbosa TaxID=529605 RepID=A0AAV1CTL6_OLDCO|nr:OLC1v1035698C1 [Oldenlandia corymbosa var. corymbosa]